MSMMKKAALSLVLVSLFCAGCSSMGGSDDQSEPTLIDTPVAEEVAAIEDAAPADEDASKQEEGEVPLVVAESEQPAQPPAQTTEEVIVQGRNLNRHEVIHDLVAEGQKLLRDVELQYVFSGKGKREIL